MGEVLIDKQYRQYDHISRYSQFPIYYHTLDKKFVTGTTAYLRNDTPYINYKVLVGDTYDSIALSYYGNPTLYWVICSFNRIQDPFLDPEENTVLKIPVLSSIEFGE